MTVVALLSVTAVVAWARVGAGRSGAPTGPPVLDEGGIPTTLAGGMRPGDVPEAVAGAVDLPVLGARVLDELPEGVEPDCIDHAEFTQEPDLELVVVTPDGMRVFFTGPGDAMGPPGPDAAPGEDALVRAECFVEFSRGGWHSTGGSFGPADDDVAHLGSSSSCCDERGLGTASAAVAAQGGASWALQDRGSWYLAYPLGDRTWLPVTWKYREARFAPGGPPPTHVLLVDDQGGVVAETSVGGQF